MFKWKPAQYNVARAAPDHGAGHRARVDPAARRRPPHADAQADAAAVPRRGDRALRGADRARSPNREIDGWRPGETIRTRTVAQTITMEVIIRAVFGITDPGADRRAQARCSRGCPRPNPLLLLDAEGPRPAQPLGALPRAAATASTRCSTRRSSGAARDPDGDGRDDILTLLLSARDEDGNPLTDRELRDELITLLLAGHETTATSIGWAFERLLRTPRRARAADRRGRRPARATSTSTP